MHELHTYICMHAASLKLHVCVLVYVVCTHSASFSIPKLATECKRIKLDVISVPELVLEQSDRRARASSCP